MKKQVIFTLFLGFLLTTIGLKSYAADCGDLSYTANYLQNQTVCLNGDVTALEITMNWGALTLTRNESYQWQISSDNSSWSDISGATGQSYTPSSSTAGIKYYRCKYGLEYLPPFATWRKCTKYTSSVSVTVMGTITTSGNFYDNQTACFNGSARALDVTGGGANANASYSYQWQSSTSSGGSYSNVTTGNSVIPPTTTAGTTYYQCVISAILNGHSCSMTTSPVYCKVLNAVAYSTNGFYANQTICNGGTPQTLGVTGAGNTGATYAYQWQSSDNASSGFTDIVSATSSTYAPPTTIGTRYYQCIITSTVDGRECTKTTDPVYVTILSVTATARNAAQTLCTDGTPTALTVSASSEPVATLAYQWKVSADSTTFTANATGTSNTASYTPTIINGTRYYRCLVTASLNNTTCSANSALSAVNVINVSNTNTLSNQTVCIGSTPTTLTVSGQSDVAGTTYAYQWQSSSDNSNFTDIADETAASFIPPTTVGGMVYYRCKISATANSVTCEIFCAAVSVKVLDLGYTGTTYASQTLCNGSTPTAWTIAGTGASSYTYQWQNSTDSTTYNTITTATLSSYTPIATDGKTYYRCLVTATIDGVSCTINSAPVYVAIMHVSNTTSLSDQTVCKDAVPTDLVVSGDASVADASLAYQWQSSTDNNTFSDIADATQTTYTPSTAHGGTIYYKCKMTASYDGVECTGYSSAVAVHVHQVTVANTTYANQTICPGATPTQWTITVDGVSGSNYSYQWQSSSDKVNFTDITSANENTYTPEGILGRTYYICQITSSIGSCVTTSDTMYVEMMNISHTNTISSQSLCDGTPSEIDIEGSGVTGAAYTYQWQSSTNNSNFIDIIDSAVHTFTPPTVNGIRYYRCQITAALNGVSCTNATESATVTIMNVGYSANPFYADKSYAPNATVTTLAIQPSASVAVSSYTYQWQQRDVSDMNFTDISDQNSTSYSPSAATIGITYYRCAITAVYNGFTCIKYTDPVFVTVRGFTSVDSPADTTMVLLYDVCDTTLKLAVPSYVYSGVSSFIDTVFTAPARYSTGTTVVSWKFTDDLGNSIMAYQNVIVMYPPCGDHVDMSAYPTAYNVPLNITIDANQSAIATDVDGNIYHTTRMGCSCWTKENMKVTHYASEVEIPAYYKYYSDLFPDTNANVNTFGLLYSWYSAVDVPEGSATLPNIEASGHVRGICPTGWYLPAIDQYYALNANYTLNQINSENYWINGAASTGGSIFEAYPAGLYNASDKSFYNLMGESYFWTSSASATTFAMACSIQYGCPQMAIDNFNKGNGYSVRCVKNDMHYTIYTNPVTDLSENTATLNGTISAAVGSVTLTANRGFCYSKTNTMPTVSGVNCVNVEKGIGTGAYSAPLTSLSANTWYYVRAYMVLSGDTMYGNLISFITFDLPAVTTGDVVTDINKTAATCCGNVTFNGNTAVLQRGICYSSTSTDPSLTNSHVDASTNDTGKYTIHLSGLTPNTTYYFKAYVRNSVGTTYGSVYAFKTMDKPNVTTDSIKSIMSTYATIYGNVTFSGNSPIVARGFCYGTSANVNAHDNDKVLSPTNTTGSYSVQMNGLMPNTVYYVRAFVINSVDTAYGDEMSFVTLDVSTLLTKATSSITHVAAVLNGEVTFDGHTTITGAGFCYSLTADPEIGANGSTQVVATTYPSHTGSFSAALLSLTANTTYHVRAYATNIAGTAYGNDITFITLDVPQVTTLATVTHVAKDSAVCGGNVTFNGNTAIIARGICFSSTNQTPTIANATALAAIDNNYTVTLKNLTANTTYYFRAYATNSVGTSYGDVYHFITYDVPAVTTNSAVATSNTGATCVGQVTFAGNTDIIAQGICYATTANPDLTNSSVSSAVTNNPFTVSITGLTQGTTYHVRAYARNSEGASYGADMTFTTFTFPSVTTGDYSNISYATATGAGNVTNANGGTVTTRGVRFSTSSTMTTPINNTDSQVGLGSYTVNASSLADNTLYYYQAYAINQYGTGYGEIKSFTTLPAINQSGCDFGTAISSVSDGTYSYGVMRIGNQCWMKSNLRGSHGLSYREGWRLNYSSKNSYQFPNADMFNNNSIDNESYGYLYDWYGATGLTSSSSNQVQGICPTGWHIPSAAEWNTMTQFVYSYGRYQCDGNIAKALASTSGWSNSSNSCAVGNSQSNNNSTGFNAFPAGYWWGTAYSYEKTAGFWTTSENDAFVISYDSSNWSFSSSASQFFGTASNPYFSVRCVRNE